MCVVKNLVHIEATYKYNFFKLPNLLRNSKIHHLVRTHPLAKFGKSYYCKLMLRKKEVKS
jgi:hypothetical protein